MYITITSILVSVNYFIKNRKPLKHDFFKKQTS
jgi:hypothetical protein